MHGLAVELIIAEHMYTPRKVDRLNLHTVSKISPAVVLPANHHISNTSVHMM